MTNVDREVGTSEPPVLWEEMETGAVILESGRAHAHTGTQTSTPGVLWGNPHQTRKEKYFWYWRAIGDVGMYHLREWACKISSF